MNRNKALTTGLLLAGITVSSAWADTKMHVEYSSSQAQTKSFVLTDATKLTFGQGAMTVSETGAASESIKLSDIAKIKFTSSTGIESAVADSDIAGKLDVYSLQGFHVLSMESWQGRDFSSLDLPAGIYIAKVNNTTFKFIKK